MDNLLMDEKGIYKTTDLYLSAWLLLNGIEILNLDRSNSRRCDLIFKDREDRPILVHEFMCGSATGNVADSLFYLKKARRLLYAHNV